MHYFKGLFSPDSFEGLAKGGVGAWVVITQAASGYGHKAWGNTVNTGQMQDANSYENRINDHSWNAPASDSFWLGFGDIVAFPSSRLPALNILQFWQSESEPVGAGKLLFVLKGLSVVFVLAASLFWSI